MVIDRNQIQTLSFLSKAKYIDQAITITTNPRLQFIIIFKNIHTHRMAFTGQRNYFGKSVFIDFKNLHCIAALTGDKQELVIF